MSEVYALQPRVKESGATEKMSEEGKEGADALQTDKWLNECERQRASACGETRHDRHGVEQVFHCSQVLVCSVRNGRCLKVCVTVK